MSDAEPSVFALLTAPGRGGIAVIRCTGPAVADALAVCFRPAGDGETLRAVGRLAYGHVLDAGGRVLDEIILHRTAPATWEVNCHGGPAAVEAVCDRLASLGLAPVGSDVLLAAEGAGSIERAARRLLRSAATPLAARVLLDQLAGALERAVADVEASLAAGRTDGAAASLDALLDRWRTCGRYLAQPPRVVIAGRPNVGKSTLLNRLAGRERAITHPEPGTTRDYVEAVAAFDGLPVVLVDTAGLRETVERIDREGVARARRQAAGADLVLYLLDAEAGATEEDEEALAQLVECGGRGDPPRKEPGRVLPVWNKADLAAGSLGPPGALAASARTGEGLDGLRQAVLARLDYRAPDPGAAVPLTREQAEELNRARALLAEGRAEEARQALAALTSH